jgi:uncharacterized membrane protein (UPF0127 family)
LKSLIISSVFLIGSAAGAVTRDLAKLYEKDKFMVGSQKIEAFVADDESRRAQGLMYIPSLPDGVGMVFVFDELQPLNFWMKNTIMDLSIGYFDAHGVLINVLEMKATSVMDINPPTYPSAGPGVFALEMNANWFARHAIKPGAKLRLSGKTGSQLLRRQLKAADSSRQ